MEQWTNGATCLGEFDVQVSICVADGDWACDVALGWAS
jgi:hypothetical protein